MPAGAEAKDSETRSWQTSRARGQAVSASGSAGTVVSAAPDGARPCPGNILFRETGDERVWPASHRRPAPGLGDSLELKVVSVHIPTAVGKPDRAGRRQAVQRLRPPPDSRQSFVSVSKGSRGAMTWALIKGERGRKWVKREHIPTRTPVFTAALSTTAELSEEPNCPLTNG